MRLLRPLVLSRVSASLQVNATQTVAPLTARSGQARSLGYEGHLFFAQQSAAAQEAKRQIQKGANDAD